MLPAFGLEENMTEKKWIYRNKATAENDIRSASGRLGIPPIFVTILANRGIKEADMLPFLQKSTQDIIDPMRMADMDTAAERVKAAVENKEKIVVYGDYDVDGITSTSLLYDFLTSLGADAGYYIPERDGEGYGINIMAVNKLVKQGVKLMISVDCGITAIGEVEFASLQGMDVIITDHHTCKERLPSAAKAIVNPKRDDDEYPFKELAGVGVAFKLALAVSMKMGIKTIDTFNKYIDLAAIGTIADVVPLVGENRIIADRGIKKLRHTKRPGLAALLEKCGTQPSKLNASSVAFSIAPRLNAAGRLGSAETGVRLLLAGDAAEAEPIAAELDEQNKERQLTEQRIFDEALEIIAEDPNFEKKKVIVLAKEGWHHGVIGIVASRVCEKFYKPCILISHSNGTGKGSGRSIKGFDLFEALSACEDSLVQFGGHKAAAGLTINVSDIEKFTEKINKYADEKLTPDDMIPKVNIDCAVSERALTLKNAENLARLEPFGVGNEKPVFSLSNAVVAYAGAVGADKKHLRLSLKRNGVQVNAIGFYMGGLAETLKYGDAVDAAFQMDINSYQGSRAVQLILKDVKKHNQIRD